MEEIIDLNLDNNEDTFNLDDKTDSGLEYLLNNKIKTELKNDISLEKELEEFNDLGDIGGGMDDTKYNNDFVESSNINIDIGKSTSNYNEPEKFKFKKIDEINIENETSKVEHTRKEDILREKFDLLRKLENLENKGANVSKKYTMDSSLDEMKGEYETIISEKERLNSIKFQGRVLTTFITGLEFLNNKLDPFDIKLDGWSEQINENLEDYDDIFQELHQKYKSKAKMAPEVKLVFQLASSAMMIHMTNTMFKSAIPGMDDIMRQNPDLMNNFTKAAVNSMGNNNPGLSNFMNNFGMSHSEEPKRYGPSDFREEMKGPENIDNILNNLNKKINVEDKNESTVSIDEIDNISISSSAPSISKRKKKSDKNTISLVV